MKKAFLLPIILIFASKLNAQEIFCNVQVNASQIQTSDRKVFQTLQTAIYEFVNNTKWSNTNVKNEERIECTFLINIKEKVSNDEYKASIQVQSTRPVYGTSYKSTMLNYLDNNFRFRYLEYQALEFNENTHISNLTSVLAYYVYIVLGLDFDTFSEYGGATYFIKAQNIVNNAQNAREIGWKAFESDKNRYWLAHDLLDTRYEEIHSCFYRYYRGGMDIMAEKSDDARYEITEALEELRGIYRENPSAFILKLFFDAKSDEIIKIYSEAFPNEQARIIKLLTEIDPANSTKYQAITAKSRGK
ncbi:MAG: hypothetical protein CBC83_09755 [Flavobacteriales bacterium TMED123]|nr:MAG: hypothetical protein CBC83_09755 [Flavobacteriales bacterium TMED123]|tara:strand:+ start:8862 stop:9770 length:909 start_codon:yes stop_codon:yes gene_type:complete